jgi:RNA polymerase sigma factor (sigma-70 family)
LVTLLSIAQPQSPPAPRLLLFRLLNNTRAKVLAYVSRQIPQDLRHLLEPEDIFQGVCCRASGQMGGRAIPEDPDAALRWIMTVARNFLIDRVRELRAQKRGGGLLTEVEIRHGSVVAMLQDLALYSRTPSASAAAHEFLQLVEQGVGRLATDQQSAVRLQYIEGLSLAEAAIKMCRTEGAIRKLCERGLAQLRVDLRTASMYI